MSNLDCHRAKTNSASLYAGPEDFEQIFATENTDLLRLSLQLTADASKAGTGLTLAMRDCLFRSNIARHRVHTWVRRLVIRNAIRLVWGTPTDILCNPDVEFYLQPSWQGLESLQESIAVLGLPALDRLAFVICVLERYSILDCAVFLGKTPREVHEAVVRATDQVSAPERRKCDHCVNTPSVDAYGMHLDRGIYFESSCGSIADHDCR